jgi:hypothetical protein
MAGDRLRALVPDLARRAYRRAWRWRQKRWERTRTPREVFGAIYARGLWGRSDEDLSSGGGSRDGYVGPYAEFVARTVEALGLPRVALVDLGCGDFQVGRHLVGPGIDYLGVDVVPDLIQRNRERFGAPNVRFECLDVTADPLPPGDLCLVRQVLQHLSNRQIQCVLEKLARYPLVLVTEHQPTERAGVVPNLDKIHGFDTRLAQRSGVYLEEPPFCLEASRLRLVLELPYAHFEDALDQGVLRTFELRPPPPPARGGA